MLLFCIIMLAISTMILNEQELENRLSQENINMISEKIEQENELKEIEKERNEEEGKEILARQEQPVQEQTPQQVQQTAPPASVNIELPSTKNMSEEELREEVEFYLGRGAATAEVGDIEGSIDFYKQAYLLKPSLDALIAIGELSMSIGSIEPLKSLVNYHIGINPNDKSNLGKYLDYIKQKERHL